MKYLYKLSTVITLREEVLTNPPYPDWVDLERTDFGGSEN